MDEKIISTLDKIYRLSQQNAEFDSKLRKRLNVASATSAIIDDERIIHIYEYCIEKILRKQAEEFYKDFPIKSIIPTLIEDFVRMESFRRKDNFGDFCLALYQQIECMTNKVCEDATLDEVVSKMWGCPAYVKVEQDKPIDISKRGSENYVIANLVFPGKNKTTGTLYAVEKSLSALQTLFAKDKIKTIVYFLGYKAMMRSGDYDNYREFTSLIDDIYQCRNMNHRGNTPKEWETEIYNRVLPLKSFYYFKFMGVLAQYLEYIKSGIPYIPQIKNYCDSIEKQKVKPTQLKIKGKIELKDDDKKRFK